MGVMAELHIVMDTNGTFSVNGCINQPVMAYGLLELAKDAVRRTAEEAQKKVREANPGELLKMVGN